MHEATNAVGSKKNGGGRFSRGQFAAERKLFATLWRTLHKATNAVGSKRNGGGRFTGIKNNAVARSTI